MAKLMAQLRVHNTEELCGGDTPLADNRLFQYALKFAGEEELPAIEREYQRACCIMKDKDSRALAKKTGQFIGKEFRAGNTGSILL